jgi:hypothetical protein
VLLGVAALGAIVAASSDTLALTVDCQVANAANIAAGLATVDGYTIGAGISAAGALQINSQTLTLPENGIICVASLTCAGTNRTLEFARNFRNTPVYLLVENDAVLAQSGCGIDVSGKAAVSQLGVGLDRLGGLGGPGGSDGGSCDFTFGGATKRAGEGIGPGGGRAVATQAGGGGASPVTNGGNGFSGAQGGVAYSSSSHRTLHGGSGGGCGSMSSQTVWAGGGGGGGVLVLGAGGQINLSSATSFLNARGGATTGPGGGGGGGVVRLVADTIVGSGIIRVDGSNGGTCGVSGTPGGCGGAGLIKLEGTSVTGSFITSAVPPTAVFFGVQQDPVPSLLDIPILEVTSVAAKWNGVTSTQPLYPAPTTQHVHRGPGAFLEAPVGPTQVVTVTLTSNNVPHTAPVRLRMNALGTASQVVTATTTGSGSGVLTWTGQLTVPGGMELGTIEAWIENVCPPGTPGCN